MILLFNLLVLLLAVSHAEYRVIGGDMVAITKAPYIALISEDITGHYCAGTIISPRVIATAAHCLDGANPRNVRVGSRDDTKGGAVYGVYKSVGHSKYKSYHGVDATYDYGVVILKKPLKLSRRVMIANLARDTLNEGSMLTLSGFGDGQFLMQSSVPIYDQEVCISNYGSIPMPLDPDVSFCAGFESGNVTSCFGDSGGPLVIGERTLYGIVSWGDDDCGLPHFPPVFARVSTMAEWFQAYIDEYV